MKKIVLAAALMCGGFSLPASAQNIGAATSIGPIATDLAGRNWGGAPGDTEWLNACGYNSCTDNGGGVFHRQVCTPNGGTCIADSAGHTFWRWEIKGDIQQWGITAGSTFDATANGAAAADATATLNTALTSLAAAGIYNVTTGGVSFKETGVVIPQSMVVDCGVAITVQIGTQDSGTNWLTQPGTIFTGHSSDPAVPTVGVTVTTGADNSAGRFHDCHMVPQWLLDQTQIAAFGGETFTYPYVTHADHEKYREDKILAGETAVKCGSQSCDVGDLTIIGYDTAVWGEAANHLQVSHIYTDANIGNYNHKGGSGFIRTDNLYNDIIGQRGSADTKASEIWSVTADVSSPDNNNADGRPVHRITGSYSVAADGSGTHNTYLCSDLKDSRLDSHGNPITYPFLVANVSNSNIDGTWPIKVISITNGSDPDTCTFTIDLLESDFAGAVTTAQWDAGSTVLRIRGPQGNYPRLIAHGQTITGVSGIPDGATVLYVVPDHGHDPADEFQSTVVLDRATTADQHTDATVTFANAAFVWSTHRCTTTDHECGWLQAMLALFAGGSPGGIATAKIPANNGSQMGVGVFEDEVTASMVTRLSVFGHRRDYIVGGGNHSTASELVSDTLGKPDDKDDIGLGVYGSANSASIEGPKSGKSGTSYWQDQAVLSANGDATATTAGMPALALNICRTACNLAITVTSGAFRANGGNAIITCTLSGTTYTEKVKYGELDLAPANTLPIIQRGVFGTLPGGNLQSIAAFPSGCDATTTTVADGDVGPAGAPVMLSHINMALTTFGLTAVQLIHGKFSADSVHGLNGVIYSGHNMLDVKAEQVSNSLHWVFEDSTAKSVTQGTTNSCDGTGDCLNTTTFQTDTIATFGTSLIVPSYTHVSITGAGGQNGTFTKLPSGTTCTPDGYGAYCLADSAGNDWTRDGFAAHPSMLFTGYTSGDALPRLTALFTAAQAAGAKTVYQDGVSFSITSGSADTPQGITFEGCSTGRVLAPATTWTAVPCGIYLNVGTPGSPTGYTLKSEAQSGWEHVTLLNNNATVLALTTASTRRQMLNAKALMNGTAWTPQGEGGFLRDALLLGFTTCLDTNGQLSLDIQRVNCHAEGNSTTPEVMFDGAHAISTLTNLFVKDFMYGGATTNAKTTMAISAVADDGTGQCKLTVASFASDPLQTNDWLNVHDAGTCDGFWQVTIPDNTHIVLNGSSIAPTATFTSISGSKVISVATMPTGNLGGAGAAGTGIPGATTIVNSGSYQPAGVGGSNLIQLSAAATATGTHTLTITNAALSGSATVDIYLALNHSVAFDFTSSQHTPIQGAYEFGAQICARFKGTDLFSAASAVEGVFGCDSFNDASDPGAVSFLFQGTSQGNVVHASDAHAARWLAVQAADETGVTPNSVSNDTVGVDDNNGGALDMGAGRMTFNGNQSRVAGNVYVGNATLALSMAGNVLPNQQVWTQDSTAAAAIVCDGGFSTSGNFQCGLQGLPGTVGPAQATGASVSVSVTTPDLTGVASQKIALNGGGTTITAITAPANAHYWAKFNGVNTLTYNATSLVLPCAANITTASGDVWEFTTDGSGNVITRNYLPANGQPICNVSASKGGAGTANGILKADGSGNVSAAVAGTDYAAPGTLLAVTSFTSSGTWTPNAATKSAIVETQAPGGGGGGCVASASNACAAGGAGGGSYNRSLITGAAITATTITIGSGGTAGDATGSNGGDGGTTTFGALVSCPGGGHGIGSAVATTAMGFIAGGAGAAACTASGTGLTSLLSIPGGDGNPGMTLSGTVSKGGNGGSAALGNGGVGPTTASAGSSGSGRGPGGSGANSQSATGKAGALGSGSIIIVKEFR